MPKPVAFIMAVIFAATGLFLIDKKPIEQRCSTVKTSYIEPLARGAARAGGYWHRTNTGKETDRSKIKESIDGGFSVIKVILLAFSVGADYGTEPAMDVVTGLVPRPVDCALINCTVPSTPNPPAPAQPGPPLDKIDKPRLAANSEGIDAVAQAVVSYWPDRKDAIRMVAIAGAESTGWRRDPGGPTVGKGTMRGVFQINDAPNVHGDLVYKRGKDWRKIEDNTWMAYQIWKHRGGYENWSTWNSGSYGPHLDAAEAAVDRALTSKANASGAYGGGATMIEAPAPVAPQPKLDQQPETSTPAPGCTTGGGSGNIGGLSVGTWNTAARNFQIKNSPESINANAGFADLVALQEVVHNDRLNVSGYLATDGGMAVPIIWNPNRVDLVWWKKERSLRGFGTRKSVVYGVWKTKDGQQFWVINTHQLVDGGRGWDKQADAVNRIRKTLQATGLPGMILGDFNASAPKIAASFGGGAGVGHGIDRMIGFGTNPDSTRTWSKGGSDHHRVQFIFAATARKAPQPLSGTDPSGSGRAGAKRIALKMGATYAAYHSDPQGQPSMDMGIKNIAAGNQIARHLIENRKRYDVEYVIFNRRIYSDRRGWVTGSPYYRPATGDHQHIHHVHATFNHG